MEFDIYFMDNICGKATCYIDGIDVVFDVKCELLTLEICKVYLKTKTDELSLGVLIPKNDKLILKKKMPKSYFNRLDVDHNTEIYIKTNVNITQTAILADFIADKYLKSIICDKIVKKTFSDYDIYYTDCSSQEFLFDFCVPCCFLISEENHTYIAIKTDKKGNILNL